MKNINLVHAEDLDSIEDYAASLISGMASLKTLSLFHFEASKKGLLDEDEEETSKTICWEIQRLLMLYQAQVNQVLERGELKEEDILDFLKTLMPKLELNHES